MDFLWNDTGINSHSGCVRKEKRWLGPEVGGDFFVGFNTCSYLFNFTYIIYSKRLVPFLLIKMKLKA